MTAGAFTEKELLVGKCGLYDHAVVFVIHVVQEIVAADELRKHVQHERIARFKGYGNQFDPEVLLARVLNILFRQVLDTKVKDIVGVNQRDLVTFEVDTAPRA